MGDAADKISLVIPAAEFRESLSNAKRTKPICLPSMAAKMPPSSNYLPGL